MKVILTHVVFRVTGDADQLEAFDARLKLLFIEHGITSDFDEHHGADALRYDFKVQGGVPFPPFAIASGEFPDVIVAAEWVAAGSGVRGSAVITRGELTEKLIENVAAADDDAVAIRVNANGFLALALSVARIGPHECRGYMMTGSEDALFNIARNAASGTIELWSTQGASEWSRAWHLSAEGDVSYRAINPVLPIADADFRDLTKLAQEFVGQWIWFGDGPREEIAIERERYERAGYAISDANVKSAALYRIKGEADEIRYNTLDPEIGWIEDVITRCWPRRQDD
ncbi:MAG: hypothetical protein JWN94_1526 [Betaproteobacteria bacterium]|nr:hypothetical protein [Betaproteobacteria bacterium]